MVCLIALLFGVAGVALLLVCFLFVIALLLVFTIVLCDCLLVTFGVRLCIWCFVVDLLLITLCGLCVILFVAALLRGSYRCI